MLRDVITRRVLEWSAVLAVALTILNPPTSSGAAGIAGTLLGLFLVFVVLGVGYNVFDRHLGTLYDRLGSAYRAVAHRVGRALGQVFD